MMDLKALNTYLEKLHGDGRVVSMDPEAETLAMKFSGSAGGPYDDGEIELTFTALEAMNLPLFLIPPVQMHGAEGSESELLLPKNYRWDGRTLWIFPDAVGARWHVYAGSYSVKVLPAFWKRP